MTDERRIANEAFVEMHKEKTRASQGAKRFERFGAYALRLRGWDLKSICDTFAALGGRKPVELVVPDKNKPASEKGDVVTRSRVFASSENVKWDNDGVSFYTDEGMLLSIDEYVYAQKHGLKGTQFFAQPEKKDVDVNACWKSLVRRSVEARRDKAVHILYITLGAIRWTTDEKDPRGNPVTVLSPLFLCPVKEFGFGKGRPQFTLVSDKLLSNPVLARTIKTRFGVELYGNCPKADIGYSQLVQYMEQIAQNLSGNREIELLDNDMHLCLLDSSNEMTCQAIERNMSRIAESELVSVFAETQDYEEKYKGALPWAIYPLPADDSQREVIARAISGDSLNVHAGPGTGKSQTVVNVIANLVLRGKRVGVISEKAAANEVVSAYSKRIGMDAYILELNERTTPREIVSQIKRSLASANVYVETERARSAVERYREATAEIEKLNRVYELLPKAGTNLYQIIGEAMSAEELDCEECFTFNAEYYRKAQQRLDEFQSEYLSTVSEREWREYLANGSMGDEEQDEIFDEVLDELDGLGVDVKAFVRKYADTVVKSAVAQTLKAQLARIAANYYVEELGLRCYGNRRLKMLYKKLLGASSAMQAVSVAFLKQELSKRVKEGARGNRFVELLDRLATSRISLQDFFTTYGEDIVKACPIIVSTPGVLVNYDKLNSFDVLLVDESSQMPFTSVLPFLLGKRQLVAFGDPMQLDITSYFAKTDVYGQDEDEAFDLAKTDKSILHVMQGKLPGCQLKYHYRSKTERLLTVSNARCYDGLLNVAPDVYGERGALPQELGYELIEIDSPVLNSRGANLSEAKAIVERALEFKRRSPSRSIGVVTFNELQQNAVYDEIDKRSAEEDNAELLSTEDGALWVRTLENAQGKEADIMLISIGHARRNKDGTVNKAISEICKEGGLNRLNVLFTRAREKVVIAISFPYTELKSTDNKGVYRLYEYLRYAATGECEGVTDRTATADSYNGALVKRLRKALPSYTVTGKIGNAEMTVDATLGFGDGRYALGVLLPSRALSPNAICTKVSVLERAGWNLLPLSPISCFTKPQIFEAQLFRDADERVTYVELQTPTYETETPPPEAFTIAELVMTERLENALTAKVLLEEDFDAAYANVWNLEIRFAEVKDLARWSKEDMQAKLRLITMRLPDFINGGRLPELIEAIGKGYDKDKTYAYLYAQLLRVRGDGADKELIQRLLHEAELLGVKVWKI